MIDRSHDMDAASLGSAKRLLESLGSTADEVAKSLKATGVKGRRFMSTSCPLARLLRNNGWPSAVVGLCAYPHGRGKARVNLPVPVDSFRLQFDQGKYPELEEGNQP